MMPPRSRAEGTAPGESLVRRGLSIVGSLGFGALLLMLLLVAMACGTVYEARHGLTRAQAAFYGSWWFVGLLLLLALNVLGAILVRWPLKMRRMGFLLTHGGLMLIVAGALGTRLWGVDGLLALREGESSAEYRLAAGDGLTLLNRATGVQASVDLGAAVGGFAPVARPASPPLVDGAFRVDVQQYLPDSVAREQVVDDNPRLSPAVEVVLSGDATGAPAWLFAEQPKQLARIPALYRYIADPAEFAAMVDQAASATADPVGTLRLEVEGEVHEQPAGVCTDEPCAFGQTGHRVRVLRYLPHATVGPDRQIVNASNEPVNPAVEVEWHSPSGDSVRICYAKYPDFGAPQEGPQAGAPRLVFLSAAGRRLQAPLEILGGPGGTLAVRMQDSGGAPSAVAVTPGAVVPLPWPGLQLKVLRQLEHSRIDHSIEPVDPPRAERTPALLVQLTSGPNATTMWLQKGRPSSVSVDGTPYELLYEGLRRPLGFAVALDDFNVRYYPGGGAPRSFESKITLAQPGTGDTRSQVVSMNHPVKFGGFTLFQSSYQFGGERATSILSVSRDPGLPLVFAGYGATFLGMLWVLVTRVRQERRLAGLGAEGEQT